MCRNQKPRQKRINPPVSDTICIVYTKALTQKAFGAQVFVNGNKNISSIFNNTGFSDSNASYQLSFDDGYFEKPIVD